MHFFSVNINNSQIMKKIQFGELDPDTVGSNAITAGISHNFAIAGNFGIEAGLNIPVLFNYAFPLASDFSVKVLLGPKMFYGISDKVTTYANGEKGYTVNSYDDENIGRFNVSGSIGLAGEWCNKFRFMLGYDLGITDIDHSELSLRKQSMLTFTLGYIF